MKNKIKNFNKKAWLFLTVAAASFMLSCELEPVLPESGSIPDLTPPSADFIYQPSAESFKVVGFTNLSLEATNYLWDFGTHGVVCDTMTVDGVHGVVVCGTESTTMDENPQWIKFDAGEGSYPVKLSAIDANQATTTVEITIELVDKFVPLPVTIKNGDFEDNQNDWKISFSNGWDSNGFESSSDGSFIKYDGSDNGAKTRGAKWNKTRSVGSFATNNNTRVAYQAIKVSPTDADRTVKYILEFEYAIKTDAATDAPEGRIVIADVVDGHYTDGFESYQNTDRGGGTSLLHLNLSEAKGKGVFTTVQEEFTTNASGEVSLMFSAISAVDVYIDNVKVYPAN